MVPEKPSVCFHKISAPPGRRLTPPVLWALHGCLMLFLVAASPAATAQEQARDSSKPRTIVAAVPKSWPPQYSLDENGKPTGFAIDVMEEVAKRAGLTVEYSIKDDFPAVVDALIAGEVDLIPNVGILPEREAEIDFTAPVETFVVSLFVHRTTNDLKGVADLPGHRLAVVEKNIGIFLFGKREDVDIRVYKNVRTALFDLVTGQVDALVYPQPVISKSPGGPG